MSPEMSEERSTPPQSRTKQERIRDNQRRSRARRQEYLADLEHRLSQCQITCRDADIQRAAFLELQIENTRLRELLALAGVNDEFVEHYVSQAVSQSGQFPQEINPSLRQLKPKISNMEPTRALNNNTQPIIDSRSGNRTANPVNDMNIPAANLRMPDATLASTPTNYISSSPFPVSSLPEMNNSATTFDWLYQQPPSLPSQSSGDDFCCDTFGLPAQGPIRIADDNSILCSVAKQMIDQYHISSVEMEQIKAKLSKGFCRPAYSGGGCAVDNQTLFQILNELSARYS